jgi:hypothetical protein
MTTTDVVTFDRSNSLADLAHRIKVGPLYRIHARPGRCLREC